jgi:hypothetical protein
MDSNNWYDDEFQLIEEGRVVDLFLLPTLHDRLHLLQVREVVVTTKGW